MLEDNIQTISLQAPALNRRVLPVELLEGCPGALPANGQEVIARRLPSLVLGRDELGDTSEVPADQTGPVGNEVIGEFGSFAVTFRENHNLCFFLLWSRGLEWGFTHAPSGSSGGLMRWMAMCFGALITTMALELVCL